MSEGGCWEAGLYLAMQLMMGLMKKYSRYIPILFACAGLILFLCFGRFYFSGYRESIGNEFQEGLGDAVQYVNYPSEFLLAGACEPFRFGDSEMIAEQIGSIHGIVFCKK